MKWYAITSTVLAGMFALSACGGGASTGMADTASTLANDAAPLTLSVTAISATQVTMQWHGSVGSGGTYRIYRDGKLDAATTDIEGGAMDTGLTPGTRYCYRVAAANHTDAGSDQSCVTTATLAGWKMDDIPAAPSSLALDSQGLEHVGYCSQWNGVIYQVRRPDGSWDTTVVDPAAQCLDAPLAVGGDGSVHMIYMDEGSDTLKYASNVTGRWVVSEIPGTAGAEFYVMALDNNDHVHVAYQLFTGQVPDCFHILYATDASGTWQSEVVAHGDAYPAIAVDGNGAAYLAFLGGQAPDGTYPVHYLSDVTGVWTDSIVASSTDSKSLVALTTDPAGNGYLAYKSHASLEYLSDESGSWRSTQVDSFDATGREYDSYGAYDVSIALDSSGMPHVSYEDSSGNLKYGSSTGLSWDSVYVDTQGGQNKLFMDAAGHAHIVYAYLDPSLNSLYSKLAVSP